MKHYLVLFVALANWTIIHFHKKIDARENTQVEIIAPGIISTNMAEYSPTFDTNRGELYFMRRTPGVFDYTIYKSKRVESSWTEPEVVSFSGKYRDAAPYLSPDGNTMYFDSRRPDNRVGEASINLWYSNRIGEDWNEPQLIAEASVNKENEPKVGKDEFGPSVDAQGKLYFYSFRSPLRGGARYSTNIPYSSIMEDDAIPDPSYNTFVSYLYISPDGKLAITEGRGKTGSDTDLYYSVKSDDNTWSQSMPLDNINTVYREGGPYISPDGKYLFFTSDRPANQPNASSANLYLIETKDLGISYN
ncbi:MAG: hypothetical protein HKN68_11870 [Saprospiraceae bacterium]|nr:hypothetical protein [Saprospiraceae bacterium]